MLKKSTESLFYVDYDHYHAKLRSFIRFDPQKLWMSFKGEFCVFSCNEVRVTVKALVRVHPFSMSPIRDAMPHQRYIYTYETLNCWLQAKNVLFVICQFGNSAILNILNILNIEYANKLNFNQFLGGTQLNNIQIWDAYNENCWLQAENCAVRKIIRPFIVECEAIIAPPHPCGNSY